MAPPAEVPKPMLVVKVAMLVEGALSTEVLTLLELCCMVTARFSNRLMPVLLAFNSFVRRMTTSMMAICGMARPLQGEGQLGRIMVSSTRVTLLESLLSEVLVCAAPALGVKACTQSDQA